MRERIRNRASRSRNTKKAQSALEYLLTYSWAILLIAIVGAVLYLFIVAPSNVTPPSCTFNSGGTYCSDLIFGSNAIGTSVGLFVENTKSYPISNPVLTVNVTGLGSYSGTCSPTFVPQGGGMICTLSLSQKVGLGTLVSGSLYLSANPCPPSSTSAASCQAGQVQTYTGTFNTHTTALLSSVPTNVLVTVKNVSQASNGALDVVTATVQLLGTPISGATVTFSQSNTSATLAPLSSTSSGNGNATTYISSLTSGTTLITGTFGSSSNSIAVHFIRPTFIFVPPASPGGTSVCNSNNQGQTIVTIDGNSYVCSQLPLAFSYASGVTHTYTFASPISGGPGIRYVLSSETGCGVTSYTGTLIVPSNNCTISLNYYTQYTLNTTVNNANYGHAAPANSWVNASSAIGITATNNSGYFLTSWTSTGLGSYSGSALVTTINVQSPIVQQANFNSTPGGIIGGNPSNATVTLVQSRCSSYLVTGSETLAYSSSVGGGNTIVVAAGAGTSSVSSISAPTDTQGNTWTPLGTSIASGTDSGESGVWYATAKSSGADSVSVNFNNFNRDALCIYELSGVGTPAVSQSNSTSSYTASVPALIYTANSFLLGVVGSYESSATVTGTSGFTTDASSANYDFIEHQIPSSSGSTGVPITWSSSANQYYAETAVGFGASVNVSIPSTPSSYICPASGGGVVTSSSVSSCSNNLQGGSCTGNVIYSTATTLNKDLNVTGDIIINSGVTVTSGPYSFLAGNMFDNAGTINTGTSGDGGNAGISGGSATAGGSGTLSYGGSGGGGGSGYAKAYSACSPEPSACDDDGTYGGNTLVVAGQGDTTGITTCSASTSGSTPSAPTITNANIQTWFGSGNGAIQQYLEGGGGGGGAGGSTMSSATPCTYPAYNGGAGGPSAYGIYIQSPTIIAGMINAGGFSVENGANSGTYSGGGGGGGGGVILLAYSSSYTAGTYAYGGGTGGTGGTNAGAGGSGGNGRLLTYQYSIAPLRYPTQTCVNNLGGGTCSGSISYTQNTVLSGDVWATKDILINSGVTIEACRYTFHASNMLDNSGTIAGGTVGGTGGGGGTGTGSGNSGVSYTSSYGGSGGGGGSAYLAANPCTLASAACKNNGVAGGASKSGGGTGDTICGTAGSGGTPSAPTMSNANIQTWFGSGKGAIQTYLEGAGGAGGGGYLGTSVVGAKCSSVTEIGGLGGNSTYGIFLDANALIAGTLTTSGNIGNSPNSGTAGAGGGGGGGGAIMLIYNSLYTAGTYSYGGGAGASGNVGAGNGGSGGNGQVSTFQWITDPVGAGSTTSTTTTTVYQDIYVVATNGASTPSYFAPITGGTGASGAWTFASNYSTSPFYYQSCTAYANYMYCVGGCAVSTTTSSGGGGGGGGHIYVLAPTQLSPTAVTRDSTPRYSFSSCTTQSITGYAHLSTGGMGGWYSSTAYPIATELTSCNAYNNYIYCVAGTDGANVYYAPLSTAGMGTWSSTYSYPISYYGDSCVISSGIMYCTGGTANGGTSETSSSYYTQVSGTGVVGWTATTSYPILISQGSCVTKGGYIYCMGGIGGSGTGVSNSYYAPLYATGIGTWASTTALPVAAYQSSCTVSSSDVYCVIGATNGGGENYVYYAPISSTGIGTWSSGTSFPFLMSGDAAVLDAWATSTTTSTTSTTISGGGGGGGGGTDRVYIT